MDSVSCVPISYFTVIPEHLRHGSHRNILSNVMSQAVFHLYFEKLVRDPSLFESLSAKRFETIEILPQRGTILIF